MRIHCLRSFILALMLFAFQVSAQSVTTVSISIFRDDDSLTVYIPMAYQGIDLDALEFKVTTTEATESYSLNAYSSFLGIPFDSLPNPICFRLVVTDSDMPVPQVCQSVLMLVQTLAPSDRFWFDGANNSRRLVVVNLEGQPVTFCQSESPNCSFEYTLPQPLTSSTDDNGSTTTPVLPVVLEIYSSNDWLVVYVPGSVERPVSISDLIFSVDDKSYTIRAYPNFTVPFLQNITEPRCFTVAVANPNTTSWPQRCTSQVERHNLIQQFIARQDVFWYDSVLGLRPLFVLEDLEIKEQCPPQEDEACYVEYRGISQTDPVIEVTTGPRVSNYAVEVSRQLVSEVCVRNGETIDIKAEGSIRVGQWVGMVTPEGTEAGAFGMPLGDQYDLVRALPHGVLMYRIEGEDSWYGYNSTREFRASQDGCLEFDVNDNDKSNNSGIFQIQVTIS